MTEPVIRYFDLPPEANEHFPSHGWLRGRTGVRLLRLPIMRLYQLDEPTYTRFREKGLSATWLQHRSPTRTLRNLAVCLRDLHENLRVMTPLFQEMDGEPSDKRDDAFRRIHEGCERAEISLIAAFVLLRRLADQLMGASRPLLFRKWGCVSDKLSDVVKASREHTLERWDPVCNFDVLTDALQNHTDWLDRLRDTDGIRDILIHKEHWLQISAAGLSAPDAPRIRWRITAHLFRPAREGIRPPIDLLPALIDVVAGLCAFMERLCAAAGLTGGYQTGDYLFLMGSDNDIVGFWPPVGEPKTEFPLMD